MSSDPSDADSARRRQSIPLRNLLAGDAASRQHGDDHGGRNLTPAQTPGSLPSISTYWNPSGRPPSDDGFIADSPLDISALQAALPPDIRNDAPHTRHLLSASPDPSENESPYAEEAHNPDYDESDRMPLTSGAQPISGSLAAKTNDGQPRDSFQTVSDLDASPSRGRTARSLGHDLERGIGSVRHRSYGKSLDPNGYRVSRSPSPSGAWHKAGSMVRAMSQRVVNISGESEVVDQRSSRHRSRSPHEVGQDPLRDTVSSVFDNASVASRRGSATTEKTASQGVFASQARPPSPPPGPPPNPLKGKSLGVFSPESRIRRSLCDLLVHPYTEPAILLLIVLQTVLLAVETAPNVYADGKNARLKPWGANPIDWAMLGLFIVFTVEIIIRIIVSGFFLNAAEYSTIDRSRGVKAAIADQYRAVFQPQRQKSVRGSSQVQPEPSAISRSFTTIMQGQQGLPKSLEDQQRFQLARRAFLRHGFNRLDFVAVGSFWIAFGMNLSGVQSRDQVYVFEMLSCLRILRLLALTHGTAIILRSLKKAAPLLVRVAFLISFFWLLFAIIGVQSFKSSLSRTCVWLDPLDPKNLAASFTNSFEFCGGYRDNNTGKALPWVEFSTPGSLDDLIDGASSPKGFICPRGSICLQQDNPYNGTVNFDNIFNSLELVFVIMSANTFSDLMYYTMGSDYTQAALFFGGGIMIMTLWLVNLLIAVITSSFQVIREESQASAFTVDHEPYMQSHRQSRLDSASKLQRLYDKSEPFWVLIIAVALLCQALRSATMSDHRENLIIIAEIVTTSLLDVEIAIRVGLYRRDYYRSWRNLFDLGLAIVTTIILIPPILHSDAYPWLTVFQILRVYRVVLAIPVTRKLILLVLGNATGIANLMLFVFLMTFFMAIFAAQLFRGEIPIYDDGQLNQISFYTIYNSFLGMYQILSSENWTTILYSVTSYTKSLHISFIGGIFFVGWFILSFFILINMFIAVIQENFDVSEDEKRLEQVKSFLQRRELGQSSSSNLALSTIFTFGRTRRQKDPLDYGPAMMEMLLKDAVVREFLDDQSADAFNGNGVGHPGQLRTATTLLGGDMGSGTVSKLWAKIAHRWSKREKNPFYSNIRFDGPNDTLDPRQMARQVVSATSARRKAQREYLAQHPSYNTSLYLFHPKHPLRRLCQRLVGPARGAERTDGVEPDKIAWYFFSAFIYAAIVAMVVLACVTTPLYQKQYEKDHDIDIPWYVWTDFFFAVLFTVEAIIKIIADGFFFSPNAYLRSSWGIIDNVVLITLWINVGTLFVKDGAVSRAIGAFKALRALRLLNVSDSARNTFHALIIVGWWKLLGAAFVSISLLFPFAIYGVNLFSGLLISCNDSNNDIVQLTSCFGEYNSEPYSSSWPMLAPRVVSNPYFNFDDFVSSLFTLFQIVSQEGWIDVSFAVQAIAGRGMQPQALVAQGNALFFVAFNLLATVFILTLFISVFMRNYTEQTGVAFLTAEQRSWVELRKLLRQVSPSKSSYKDTESKWKKWCYKRAIEKRSKWYMFITFVLVLHLLLLVVQYRGEPDWWSTAQEYIFLGFILIYLSNITIRIVGLGWSRYRKSSWDLYALLAVSGAFITTIALLGATSNIEIYSQFHKVFLVAVVLLLIPRNDALDQLFKTAAASLTVISNLLATWFVLFLVFAIGMTQAFSLTRFGANEDHNKNFRSVPKALILLFRMSWGEGWNQVMEDFASIQPPLCVSSADFFDSDCGSKSWATFLFVAWNLLSMYIFVNLFVSLIYESFSYVYQRSSGVAVVDRDELRRFKEAWRSVDPTGTGYISKETFPRLLGELSGVFQMRIYDLEDSVHHILDDVRSDMTLSRPGSIATAGGYSDVDLEKLNARLAKLDVQKSRERRRRFNLFYEEVKVSADPDRGISFSNMLLTLAHYNIISDNKSLKLDEFLRRRARLQRVDDEVRRRTVQGFFDTLYWARIFKKHMERKRSSRMTAVPQLGIPDILVEDDDDFASNRPQTSGRAPPNLWLSTPDNALGGGEDAGQGRASLGAAGSSNSAAPDNGHQHPLSYPPSQSGSSGMSASAIPTGFSFELYEPEGSADSPGGELSGHEPAESPAQGRGILDDSLWGDSIRRSTTLHRPGRDSYRYGDIG